MAFEIDKWADGEAGETPITAAELNRIEAAGDAASKSATWGSVSNRPSTFAPSAHTHVVGDVTGLQSIIDDLTARIEALETPEA